MYFDLPPTILVMITVCMKILLTCVLFMSSSDKNMLQMLHMQMKSHVYSTSIGELHINIIITHFDIINSQGDIINLACRGPKYATLLITN